MGRLTKRADFTTVYGKGRSWANYWVVLRAFPNAMGTPRYGIVVSKRLGKAVMRNRIKRRMREGIRQLTPKGGWDMVFIARGPAAGANYHRLKGAMCELVTRARLFRLSAPGEGEP